jgi:TonB-dependent starch-binding outer membrane protein SusC
VLTLSTLFVEKCLLNFKFKMIRTKQRVKAIFSLLIWSVLLISSAHSYAQSVKVTGSVQDEAGGFLPGVTIKENGTSNGTVTDQDGQFSLSMQSGQSSLLISSVGFESQTVNV